MGGQSVPAATQQTVQSVTGWAAVPELKKRALGVIDPALSNIHDQQQMLLGFQHGDPNQTRKLFGLSPAASAEDITGAIQRHAQGPELLPSAADVAKQGVAPEMRQLQTLANKPGAQSLGSQFGELANAPGSYKHGGIMGLHDEPKSDPRKFAKGGLTAAEANFLQNKLDSGKKISPVRQRQLDAYNKANPSPTSTAIQTAAREAGYTPADAYLNRAGMFGASYDPKTNQFSITNPYYNQATDILSGMRTQPAQFGQATDAYNQAISGLQSAASYTPQQVSAASANAAQMSRGTVRDINAILADVERYKAAGMEAPEDLKAEAYQAAQMSGPETWTTPGTAQKYMDPYMQNVVDIQKREANRDYQKQMAQQRGAAAGQRAFGGSRSVVADIEGRRNQAQLLNDIQQKGQSQAYQQGMGQFQAESGLLQQARAQNQAAINQQRQTYVTQALQAAQNNYGGKLTAAQQSMIADNAARQFNAQSQNQAYGNYAAQNLAAQQANQGMDWNVGNLNTSNQQAANILNAQLAQQAALANQQAGLQANQQNIGAYGQIGNMAQGLGGLGTAIGGYNSNLANLYGTAGGIYQGLGQNYFNQVAQNAGNIFGGPTTLAGQGTQLLSGAGGSAGNKTTTGTAGSAFP